MRKIHLKVTENDIVQGQRIHPHSCPIALAIRRVIKKGASHVSVAHNYVRIGRKKITTLPKHVNNFIKLFDANLPVLPIEFDLEY